MDLSPTRIVVLERFESSPASSIHIPSSIPAPRITVSPQTSPTHTNTTISKTEAAGLSFGINEGYRTPAGRDQQRESSKQIVIPRLKRRRDSAVVLHAPKTEMSSCTLGGHLDSPTDLRDVLGTMISDPQLHSLCDVVLVVQGERFMAHRAVLAAASCVFKAMFTNYMKERDAPEIILSSVDKHAWRMVMQYIYNAQVDLDNDDNALLLLSTARMYQLERLETFVETFLIQRVDLTSALRLVDAAERYDLHRLRDACFANMEQEFEGLALSPAFIRCPVHIITQLLSSNQLVLKSEMMVYEAVMRWVTADAQRKNHLEKLLSVVRLDRLSDGEVRHAARHNLVKSCWRFRERIFERLVSSSIDIMTETALNSRSHLKARCRDACVFTFAHTQRGMTKVPHADQEEVVRTPWSMDGTGKRVWRLKIYPQGYSRAKGSYLSMYVQGRSANKSEPLDVFVRFDIFLVNQKAEGSTISFSSQHHFLETSDHWGFHRFLQLSQMTDTNLGYLNEQSDAVVVGANLYFT